ncbi:hypothetical protein [Polyangium sorediatum]|uniref:Tetratricopeptide repeat protein n=1 Tax=Polyangium sorediatum TaxID=889274 RepID=A0ABT6P8U2_9BACT|nr:hypothetical protein [Polyangium sorediatum]MDI1436580.1 hypothetical protein [Polyangium sorediatum]
MSAAPYMDEDDVATTLMDRSARPPQSGTRPSVAHSEPPRDTVVDAPSAWSRAHAALGAAFRSVRERFRKARLSDRLPPLPPPRSMTATHVSVGAVAHDERGEQLLLDIMRAARPYQDAAVYVANYAVVLRRLGDDAYAEGLVHFALSRMRPDAEGFVVIARLRDRLPELSYSGTLVPALTRLEGAGIVALTGTTEGGLTRVLLRVPL